MQAVQYAYSLNHNLQRYNIYGGDIPVLLDLVENQLRTAKYHGAGQSAPSGWTGQGWGGQGGELVPQLGEVLSYLLEADSVGVWRDLSWLEVGTYQRNMRHPNPEGFVYFLSV